MTTWACTRPHPPGRIYTHIIFLFSTPKWLEALPYLVCSPGFSAHCPHSSRSKLPTTGLTSVFHFSKGLGPSPPGSPLSHLVSSVRWQEGVLVSASRPQPIPIHTPGNWVCRQSSQTGGLTQRDAGALAPLAALAALDTFNLMLLCTSLSCSQWYCAC